MEEKIKEFIVKSELIKTGWTNKLIDKFLGAHDVEKRNPHYRCALNMKLYKIERVKNIESMEEFIIEKKKSEIRKEHCKKSTKIKTDKLMKLVDAMIGEVKVLDKNELTKRAIDHYNDWESNKNNPDEFVSLNSNKEMLDRISVNYLRHELTNYEEHLYEIKGKVGVDQALALVNENI